MIFACINIRFKDGIPNVNFNESPTYHEIDKNVVAPRRLPKPGDTVVIRTVGFPQVKMVVDRMNEAPDSAYGGSICGKASFFSQANTPAIIQDPGTA